MGDILGRRRVFMVGLAAFSTFSLLCGLSTSSTMLIVFRPLQGAAGAILTPSVFSITTVTFAEGSERNKALGILGGIAGSGSAIGVLLGGVLTQYAGWKWIFFVNVPIGVVALVLVPLFVRESRATELARRFDVTGAISITGALMLLVFALTRAPTLGWGSAQVIGSFVGSALLMVAFVVIESRSRSPLVPLGIFKRRTLTGANVIGFLLGVAIFGMFFLLSLYMQQILGFSAIKAGVGYLALALTVVVASGIAQALVTRAGRETGAGRRDDSDRGRAALLHADLGRRHLLRRPLPRASSCSASGWASASSRSRSPPSPARPRARPASSRA